MDVMGFPVCARMEIPLGIALYTRRYNHHIHHIGKKESKNKWLGVMGHPSQSITPITVGS